MKKKKVFRSMLEIEREYFPEIFAQRLRDMANESDEDELEEKLKESRKKVIAEAGL